MRRLRFSFNAQIDLREITRYIARDNPDAARKLVAKIKDKCLRLTDNPNLGESREDLSADVRTTFVGRYVIYYRPRHDHIEISRVIRGDRDVSEV